MLINLGTVVNAAYDRLRTDSRTSAITWHFGRRSFNQIQQFPAGLVALGNGDDVAAFIPVGRELMFEILVAIRTRHEVLGTAELDMQNWVDKVLEVLTTTAAGLDNRDLQASPAAVIEGISLTTDSNPESVPPTATAILTCKVKGHLH